MAYIALRGTVRASAAAASVIAMTSMGPAQPLQLHARIPDLHSHKVEFGSLRRDMEHAQKHAQSPALQQSKPADSTPCPNKEFAQTTSQLHVLGTPGPSISPGTAYRCAVESGYSPWQSVIIVAIMDGESRREPTIYNPTPVESNNAVGVLQLLTNVQNPGGYNMHGITFKQATNPAMSLRVAHSSLGGSSPSWWIPWKGEVGVGVDNAFCKFMPTWYHDSNPASTFYCPSGAGVGVPSAYTSSPPAGYAKGQL